MNPALSVIFFTTLSGAGYGLWLWLGLRIAFGPAAQVYESIGWFSMLLAGFVLTTAGIVASLWHLGKPMRVWRAFSQWRSSWMSREGVMAIATLVAAALLVLPLGAPDGASGRLRGALLALCAIGTVASTAMIYASLKPIPAWRHPLVVPAYFGFALLTGGLLYLLVNGVLPIQRALVPMLAVACVALAAIKLAYWRGIDATPLPQSRGDAVGLPGREVGVFERPHTEANYLTREMGFEVARRHARSLRIAALLLFAAIPLACLLAASAMPTLARPLAGIASASALLGAFVERWLFFAQARHLVMLYY